MSKIVVDTIESSGTTVTVSDNLDAGTNAVTAGSVTGITGASITTGIIPAAVSFAGTVTGTGGGEIGQILGTGGTATPTGYLYCDGCAVSRTTYSALFAIISDNYGEGNGSTTFNVPDLRGLFARGQDDGSSNDPDDSTRTAPSTGANTGDNVGSYQADQNLSHTHNGVLRKALSNVYRCYPGYGIASDANLALGNNQSETSDGTGGNQTNPNNLYVRYYIKY